MFDAFLKFILLQNLWQLFWKEIKCYNIIIR